MTSKPHHLASMSSDEPRGYGVRGDARKRLEAQHRAHPDPAVRELLRAARVAALNECAQLLTNSIDHDTSGLSARDVEYAAGWNAAARSFSRSFTAAAEKTKAAQ